MSMAEALNTLYDRQAAAHGGHPTHQVVVGASGRRSACRVCRTYRFTHDFKEKPEWNEPCRPNDEALAKYRANAQRLIDEGQAMLAHADALEAARP